MNFAALLCLCLLPPTDNPAPIPGSLQFQILTKSPTNLHLDFEVDGKPLGSVWRSALKDLFADLDRNSNGSLDRVEAKRALAALRLRQLGWNYLFAVPVAASWDELDLNKDNLVTPPEFAEYYHRHGLGQPVVSVGQFAPTTKLNDALLKRVAGAGKIADRAAWLGADKSLAAADIDSDEMIRPDEILTHTLYPGSFGGTALPDPGINGKLPPLLKDLPVRLIPAGSQHELSKSQHPHLQVRVSKTGDISIERLDEKMTGEHTFIPLGEIQLALYGVPGKLPDAWTQARDVARQRFDQADSKHQGFVDRTTAIKINFAPLNDHLAFADRDGDGKLSRSEWENYLRIRSTLIACLVQITVLDSGPSLFEALDVDADGALSVRELRNAWQRLESLGGTTGDHVDISKLPRRTRFIFSFGQPTILTRRVPRSGPAWFLSMDRNNDGDVSRQEFLGDAPTFRKLDLDNDGLISRLEAEKGEGK